MSKKRKNKHNQKPALSPVPAKPEPVKGDHGKAALAWFALIALILLILYVLETIKDGLLA